MRKYPGLICPYGALICDLLYYPQSERLSICSVSYILIDNDQFLEEEHFMRDTERETALQQGRRTNSISVARRCHECNEEALGHCPDCHKGFCQDHFPKQQHSPCAEKQMRLAQTQVCYVCGRQVYPDQWSLSRTSHYIDEFRCNGCGRHVCDEMHTRRKTENISIIREGLRYPTIVPLKSSGRSVQSLCHVAVNGGQFGSARRCAGRRW